MLFIFLSGSKNSALTFSYFGSYLAKGKKVKKQKSIKGNPTNTEANVATAVSSTIVVSIRNSAIAGIADPAAATPHTVGTAC